jgi:hypothetical protein
MNKTPDCCICGNKIEEKTDPATGKIYWNQGESAMPFKDGRCCSVCNIMVVLPLRIKCLQDIETLEQKNYDERTIH